MIDNKYPIFNSLLLKVASRCNLKCKYCYWFKDESVYDQPIRLEKSIENKFLARLEEHIQDHNLKTFSIIFHGGEPLLFGKKRFIDLLDSIQYIQTKANCFINFSITTNGTLLDSDWANIFRIFKVSVTLSLDGEEYTHNDNRVDFHGIGSYEKVVNGLSLLRKSNIEPGILAVCNPSSSPEKLINHFYTDLGIQSFDILIPDANHDDSPQSISKYYIKLFDIWLNKYAEKGVKIRIIEEFIKGLFLGKTNLESIGYGPIQTLVMLPNGDLEPLDVLRLAGKSATHTDKNIMQCKIQDAISKEWINVYKASLALAEKCQLCIYKNACGGGYLPHRWSSKTQTYNHPSIYCNDYLKIFSHIWDQLSPRIYLNYRNTRISLKEAELEIKNTQ